MIRARFLYVLLLVSTAGEAHADIIMLSCGGTVELIQGGKQVNPRGEKSSLAVKVDLAAKTLGVDNETWPILGDASETVIVSMNEWRGSATLNRISGAISVHFFDYGLRIFRGVCKPAERLF
jgi:hypothetical protein